MITASPRSSALPLSALIVMSLAAQKSPAETASAGPLCAAARRARTRRASAPPTVIANVAVVVVAVRGVGRALERRGQERQAGGGQRDADPLAARDRLAEEAVGDDRHEHEAAGDHRLHDARSAPARARARESPTRSWRRRSRSCRSASGTARSCCAAGAATRPAGPATAPLCLRKKPRIEPSAVRRAKNSPSWTENGTRPKLMRRADPLEADPAIALVERRVGRDAHGVVAGLGAAEAERLEALGEVAARARRGADPLAVDELAASAGSGRRACSSPIQPIVSSCDALCRGRTAVPKPSTLAVQSVSAKPAARAVGGVDGDRDPRTCRRRSPRAWARRPRCSRAPDGVGGRIGGPAPRRCR